MKNRRPLTPQNRSLIFDPTVNPNLQIHFEFKSQNGKPCCLTAWAIEQGHKPNWVRAELQITPVMLLLSFDMCVTCIVAAVF